MPKKQNINFQIKELRPWMIEEDTGVFEMLSSSIPAVDEFRQKNEFFGLTKEQCIERIFRRMKQAYGINQTCPDPSLEPQETLPAEVYIMFADNRPVGMGGFRFAMNDYIMKHCQNIWYKVAPAERRKGYCTMFLARICSMAKNLGYEEVFALTADDNLPSNRVLQKAGFLAITDPPCQRMPHTCYYKKSLSF